MKKIKILTYICLIFLINCCKHRKGEGGILNGKKDPQNGDPNYQGLYPDLSKIQEETQNEDEMMAKKGEKKFISPEMKILWHSFMTPAMLDNPGMMMEKFQMLSAAEKGEVLRMTDENGHGLMLHVLLHLPQQGTKKHPDIMRPTFSTAHIDLMSMMLATQHTQKEMRSQVLVHIMCMKHQPEIETATMVDLLLAKVVKYKSEHVITMQQVYNRKNKLKAVHKALARMKQHMQESGKIAKSMKKMKAKHETTKKTLMKKYETLQKKYQGLWEKEKKTEKDNKKLNTITQEIEKISEEIEQEKSNFKLKIIPMMELMEGMHMEEKDMHMEEKEENEY